MRARGSDRRSRFAPSVSVSVRPAAAADAVFVDDLGKRTVMQSVAAFRNARETSVHDALDRLLEIVESQSHATLIAHVDGARAGFVLLVGDLPDEVTATPQGFIAYMAVEPEYRRRGVAAALLAAAEDEARRLGLPYMALMVTEDNAAARALYERAGYFTERRLLCKPL